MSEEIGLTCLYKNGEAKNFIGDEVTTAVKEGWKDNPTDGAKKEEAKKIGASSGSAVTMKTEK